MRSQTCQLGRSLHLPFHSTGVLRATRPRQPAPFRRATVMASGDGEESSSGRQSWDVRRFVKTVTFFNSPTEMIGAVLSTPINMIKAVTGFQSSGSGSAAPSSIITLIEPEQSIPPASSSGQSSDRGVVLVTGATGGVGTRVVKQLLQRGRRVRALVRDVAKAKELLGGLAPGPGGGLELAPGDITQAATLTPDLFRGVRAVISCTAVKVAPKEGDTKDRQKYFQGIKFYDPEIVGDTPETVEFKGLSNLVAAVKENLGYKTGKVIFSPDGQGLAENWGALDDVVMGGVSESGFQVRPGAGENGGPAAVFAGTVTTANSGGFASVRTKNFAPAADLSAYEGLELRVKGDGQRYKCVIRTTTSWDSIGYTLSFDTQPGWQTVRVAFKDFVPVFRAKTVRGGAPLDRSSITSLQIMLSKFEYDGALNPSFRAGRFELPIQSIMAYLPEPVTPRFVHVSSAGVTRPNRPGINVDVEPPAVRMNDALGGILTFKLKGEDVVRESGVAFAVVRPTALTEEPSGAELEVDQGDTIKGKISREEIAELCVELLDLPVAADTTFEIKSTVPFSMPFSVDPANPPPPRDWAKLLSGVKQGVTGKTVNGVYTGKEVESKTLVSA